MAILQPVVALFVWTMVMWLWMYATRLPAMTKAKIDPDSLALDPDTSLDNLLPPQVQWKAHNYNNLHEAPTLFYAVIIVLALLDMQDPESGTGLALWIAWAYVAIRIVHSLVQATVNRVVLRFAIFNLSQIALLALIALAVLDVFGN